MILKINHLALAVNDIEAGQTFWHDILGLPIGHSQRVAQEGVDVSFLPIGESAVELLQPFEQNGVQKFLDKRGPGLHHVCFDVANLDEMLAKLVSAEIPLITPEPLTNAAGIRYIFIHPKGTGGVLVELYESPIDEATV